MRVLQWGKSYAPSPRPGQNNRRPRRYGAGLWGWFVMNDTASAPAQSAKPPKHVKPPRVRAGKTSIDQASYYMLRLYRSNLEIRFRSIDEAALQSENQRKIYATVGQMLKSHPTTERGS